MKKLITLTLALALLCGLLTGCGKSDAPDAEVDAFLNSISAEYEELFPVLTDTAYDEYWAEEVSEFADSEYVDSYVTVLKSACTGSLYGAAAVEAYTNPEEAQFNCYFINGIDLLTVDGNTISGTLDGEDVFSYTYAYQEERNIDGLADTRVYKTDDSGAGEFTYFLFLEDTPDTTYHIEFRYGSDLDELSSLMDGEYAYWLAAGIPTDSDPDFVKSCISLFVEENLGGEADAEDTSTSDKTEYPIVITHAFGETVITEKPERVATISWGNQDVPLALGVVPVGFSEANYGVIDGGKLLPWTKEKIAELGASESDYAIFADTDGHDFEAISAVNPDVILAASSGITQEEYDILSAIAPTVAYPSLPWQTLWRDQIIIDAEAMGMKAEGEALVAELDALLAATVAQYPQLSDKTAAFIYFSPTDLSTFSIYAPGDPRCAYLADLGLTIPPSIIDMASTSDSFYLQLSSENADILSDVDIILTWGSAGDDDLVKALQSDPLLSLIPAIKNGAIVMLEEGPIAAGQTPTALSLPWCLDEYIGLIAEAAEKAE
ncbi:MAG: iron-siderophore ABC transporter substrate-binding protein [Oscillospiraceae bacterium]|jgi:iron complex transport system substrate-binding protein|nr:iron-siderophore ABC transporter substrate-binding protein [Oscillospiraceae bacterium]